MMKMNSIRKKLSFILCIVLIAAMALFTAGCNDASGAPSGTAAPAGTAFTVVVTDLQGEQTTFHYTSDKDTVGDALLAEGLIAGEDSDYGLYVTTVNGITADWDKDQTYWAFYIDGEYATTGVDATRISEGATYSFVLTGPEETATEASATEASDVTVLGEGSTVFTVVTTDLDGVESTFEVHTDAQTVGKALTDVSLIAGHDSEYGLYVDTVNGITLDWDQDGKYWAFYINGEYAMTGVDTTEVTSGAVYAFKAE